MEQDRFQHNNKLFVVGLISLMLCLSLLTLGLYIAPYLLWGLHYGVPGMVVELHEWFRGNYNLTDSAASWMVFLTFIIPAIVCGIISQWSSNYIEREMFGLEVEKPERQMEIHKDIQETISFALKIFLLIILVILGVSLVEWLVTLPTV